jgi:regulator of protease activity HflC (stomatin/prohibitin superfamily)
METYTKSPNKGIYLAVFIFVAFIVVAIMGSSMFKVVHPGERAVIFRKFTTGLDKEHIYSPGFYIIAPWNDFYVYDVREQSREETMDILDKNGLAINVDVTVRFNPEYDKIGYLHEKFGKRYVDVLVVPEVRSAVRTVMGKYIAEEIYSTKRTEVEREIIQETADILKRNYIDMKALLIRSIKLPERIRQAIDTKLQQEQEALAYQFKLEKEKSEAERKRIEAEGIAKANDIINKSLTDKLLKMKGIDATLELANSKNAKIVVIGGGKDGLPLILNSQ